MNRVLAAAIALFILVLAPTLSATPSSHVLILHMQNEADPDPAVHRIPLRHGSTFVTPLGFECVAVIKPRWAGVTCKRPGDKAVMSFSNANLSLEDSPKVDLVMVDPPEAAMASRWGY